MTSPYISKHRRSFMLAVLNPPYLPGNGQARGRRPRGMHSPRIKGFKVSSFITVRVPMPAAEGGFPRRPSKLIGHQRLLLCGDLGPFHPHGRSPGDLIHPFRPGTREECDSNCRYPGREHGRIMARPTGEDKSDPANHRKPCDPLRPCPEIIYGIVELIA